MVYENVLASSFIYAMGVISGKRTPPNETVSDSINFFQQTPTDRALGDLFAAWGGKSFIIEFKRSIGQLDSEINKEHKISLGLQIDGNRTMKGLSEKCHFLGYGKYVEIGDKIEKDIKTDFVFQSYLNVLTKKSSGEEHNLNSFISRLLNTGVGSFGLNREDFKIYLAFLLKNEEDKNSSSGKVNIKGLMTSVSPEGEVVMLEYENYKHLSNMLKEGINLKQNLNQQLSFDNAPTNNLSIKPKKQNHKDFGVNW